MTSGFLIAGLESFVTFLDVGTFVGDAGWRHKERTSQSHEVILVQRGILHLFVGEKSFDAMPGTVLIIPQGVRHGGTRPCPAGTTFYWLHFVLPGKYELGGSEDALAMARGLGKTRPMILAPLFADDLDVPRLLVPLSQLIEVVQRERASEFYLNCLAMSFLLELTEQVLERYICDGPSRPCAPASLRYVMEWIRMNLDGDLRLEALAKRFGYNPTYLSASFSRHVGCTLSQYIRRTRMEKAKALLVTLPHPVEQIAHLVGYRDAKYFLRCFKREEGMTPTQFREACRGIRLNKS